jgi:hypothetical protein
MHGNDERIKLATLKPYLEFVWQAVVEIAAAERKS